jgi:hypothetical protein
MEINRDIQYLDTLENGPEKLVVEITALEMTINLMSAPLKL